MLGCQRVEPPQPNKLSFNNFPDAKIIEILRADLIKIYLNNKTQIVHIAGIKSPSPKPGKYNNSLQKYIKQNINLIDKAGKQAVALTRELTQDRKIKFIKFGTNVLTKSGKIIWDGDILFEDKSTLAEKLLRYGAAIASFDEYRTTLDYKAMEENARKNERGFWKHPVKLNHRFYVKSSFKSETINVTRSQVRQQGKGNAKLESHKNFEKRGKILINIQTKKPLIHPYDLTVNYAFVTRRDYGKRVQEIRSAPVRGEIRYSRDGKTKYKPLTSAEKNYNKSLDQKTRDYNKKVSGQNIFDVEASGMTSEKISLDALSTNFVILSDIVNFTKSTKGDTSYSHGEYYIGYNLEIYAGTNLIYSHYHND